jgi:hypothetical protein
MKVRRGHALLWASLALAIFSSSARAQGPHGVPPGQAKRISPSGAAAASGHGETFPAFVQPRQLGAWLDDASVLAERSIWMTLSTNTWRSPAGNGVDAPIVDVAAGLAPRVQATAMLPYSRFVDPTGGRWNGVGDGYITLKVQLRDPEDGLGVATAPTLELANSAVAFDPSADRTHWVLPISVELRRTGWRAYGSGGYFTRGALFAAGALERSLTSTVSATGAVTQSVSTSDEAQAAAWGVGRRRTDVSGALAWSASPALLVFGSVGRTVSRLEYDSSRVAFSAGVSVALGEKKPATRSRKP